MSLEEAHLIHKQLSSLEFPTTTRLSLFFALFKVLPLFPV